MPPSVTIITRFVMDRFGLLLFAAVFLGTTLVAGLATLVHIRRGQRERLQMKQHVRRIDLVGEG
jgi:hypothetical protein